MKKLEELSRTELQTLIRNLSEMETVDFSQDLFYCVMCSPSQGIFVYVCDNCNKLLEEAEET